jgi:hypothetical protein
MPSNDNNIIIALLQNLLAELIKIREALGRRFS